MARQIDERELWFGIPSWKEKRKMSINAMIQPFPELASRAGFPTL
jgi:hypothetical protein